MNMTPNLAMFVRYFITSLVMYGIGAGWWTEALGGAIGNMLTNLIALAVAMLPPAWAWLFIDNEPKAKE